MQRFCSSKRYHWGCRMSTRFHFLMCCTSIIRPCKDSVSWRGVLAIFQWRRTILESMREEWLKFGWIHNLQKALQIMEGSVRMPWLNISLTLFKRRLIGARCLAVIHPCATSYIGGLTGCHFRELYHSFRIMQGNTMLAIFLIGWIALIRLEESKALSLKTIKHCKICNLNTRIGLQGMHPNTKSIRINIRPFQNMGRAFKTYLSSLSQIVKNKE